MTVAFPSLIPVGSSAHCLQAIPVCGIYKYKIIIILLLLLKNHSSLQVAISQVSLLHEETNTHYICVQNIVLSHAVLVSGKGV